MTAESEKHVPVVEALLQATRDLYLKMGHLEQEMSDLRAMVGKLVADVNARRV